MNKHKNYHMYGILAIAILILVIIFSILYLGRRNRGGTSSQQNNSGQESSAHSSKADSDSEVLAYLKEQNSIMSDMVANMSVKESGSAELDFLISMIPHHEAAIDITKSYLKYSDKNSKLKNLAREIIEEQTEETVEMRALVKEIKSLGMVDKEKERAYLDSYNKMMDSHKDMAHETETAKDIDSAYIEGMVIHHQMAVDMAKAILEITWHDEVVDIAEDIIEMQREEISQMERIFNDM